MRLINSQPAYLWRICQYLAQPDGFEPSRPGLQPDALPLELQLHIPGLTDRT